MALLLNLFDTYDMTPLYESKGLHSYDLTDEIRYAALNDEYLRNPKAFKKVRSMTSSRAASAFDALQGSVRSTLIRETNTFLKGTISKTEWKKRVTTALRTAYHRAFEIGVESTGSRKIIKSSDDHDWIRTAIKDEMQYLNTLLKEIEGGTYSGTLEKRLGAYAETLKHIYYAGRVMGTPAGHVIDWICVMDRNSCSGCMFLAENSPYTRHTLPCTPRSGDTKCLNNCRCRLIIRDVGEDHSEVEKGHNSKEWYRRMLSELKKARRLLGRVGGGL